MPWAIRWSKAVSCCGWKADRARAGRARSALGPARQPGQPSPGRRRPQVRVGGCAVRRRAGADRPRRCRPGHAKTRGVTRPGVGLPGMAGRIRRARRRPRGGGLRCHRPHGLRWQARCRGVAGAPAHRRCTGAEQRRQRWQHGADAGITDQQHIARVPRVTQQALDLDRMVQFAQQRLEQTLGDLQSAQGGMHGGLPDKRERPVWPPLNCAPVPPACHPQPVRLPTGAPR